MSVAKIELTRPRARTDGLLAEGVGSETVVYDLGSKQAHCLKPLAAFVFAHADGNLSVAALSALASEEMDQAVSPAAVEDALGQLEGAGLLAASSGDDNGVSRREFVQRAGYVGVAALSGSLITSLVAPTAAMAVTGIPTGCQGCGRNRDCASNHCCQSNAGKQCNQGCCVGANNSCHTCCTGVPPNEVCFCTVTPQDIGGPCPCICGAPGCAPGAPCCQPGDLCCVTTLPEECD